MAMPIRPMPKNAMAMAAAARIALAVSRANMSIPIPGQLLTVQTLIRQASVNREMRRNAYQRRRKMAPKNTPIPPAISRD